MRKYPKGMRALLSKGRDRMKIQAKKLIAPLCLALIIAGCIIWIVLQNSCRTEGNTAEVRVSDSVVMRFPLDKDSKNEINGANGIRLTVVTHEGGVYVESSGCPDKICVNKGKITSVGDTIVCLPARTVIEVV